MTSTGAPVAAGEASAAGVVPVSRGGAWAGAFGISSMVVTVPRKAVSACCNPGHCPGGAWEQEHDHAAGDAHTASQAAIARTRRTIGTYTNRFLSLGAKFSI